MAINHDYIGRAFPVTPPYDVSRQKIREFAEAIGDRNPAYLDPGAARALGHPDVIAPPTFAFVVSWPATQAIVDDEGLRLEYDRVVHMEQRFVHARPIRAGDSLVTATTITTIRAAGRNEVLTVSYEIATVDGEHVCATLNTLVSRGTAPARETAGTGRTSAVAAQA